MPEVSSFAVRMILIVVAVVILVVLVTQYHRKKTAVVSEETPVSRALETFADMTGANSAVPATNVPNASSAPIAPTTTEVRPSEMASNEDYKAVDFDTENKIPTDCFPRDKLTVEDLLPKDAANSTWAQVMPAGQGDAQDQNFLTAGHHVGLNTVGQSLRNANYQLRSDPPNPKLQVSVWNNSTIDFDGSRRYFEVGEC